MHPVSKIVFCIVVITSCTSDKKLDVRQELSSINLLKGDIALCTSSASDSFGKIEFTVNCSPDTRNDFNLGIAMLHSFEYADAERIFSRVIDSDNMCAMAYWGVAMANFHPLWAPPSKDELEKGVAVLTIAKKITGSNTTREAQYINAIYEFYDSADHLDHKTRLLKFKGASKRLSETFPEDDEAAIFYALALTATANPNDKTFANQKEAEAILNKVLLRHPDHPGVVHYIIHNYDYPELATLALSAARRYASIAAASAHAQHMPSHIFTRLGLWDESIKSNLNAVEAAKCYAENLGMEGHWDEELHGLDYLMYGYLQTGRDELALRQLEYVKTMTKVSPVNFKVAYAFASMPARYALERKDWVKAAALPLEPANLPWDKFLWEKSNNNFARAIGAAHLKNTTLAIAELNELKSVHKALRIAKEEYKANLVMIQILAVDGWIQWAQGQHLNAIKSLEDAADLEDGTAKHPVTPGEIIPARELLADLYFEIKDYENALEQYEQDLKIHPNRLNGLNGAAQSAAKLGHFKKADQYAATLMKQIKNSTSSRFDLPGVR
jgi:tetratricopeptide (TPR) repeat protein